MQTSSHVEIDKWGDLNPYTPIMNIRTKGTYQPKPKPVCPDNIIKPCCGEIKNCPIDNQPIPAPCDLCPINDIINDNTDNTAEHNCHCQQGTYGVVNTPTVDKELLEQKTVKVNIDKTPKKPAKRGRKKKTN
jgi:hypothetical protein